MFQFSGIRSLTTGSRKFFVNSTLYDSELRLFAHSRGDCRRDGFFRQKADFLHRSFGNSLPVRVGRPVCPTRTANPIETKELQEHTVEFGENLRFLCSSSPRPEQKRASRPVRNGDFREKSRLKITGRFALCFTNHPNGRPGAENFRNHVKRQYRQCWPFIGFRR